MEAKSYLDSLMDDEEFRIRLAEEMLLLDATEKIAQAMSRKQMKAAELAEKMGVRQGYLHNLLCGRYLTIRSLARVLHHLGYEAVICIHPLACEARGLEEGT